MLLAWPVESRAQRRGPSPERMFRFMDRDGDGTLRGEELTRFPPLRDAIEEMEIDPERGLSFDEFQDVSGELRERMMSRRGFRGRRGGDDEGRDDRFGRRGRDDEDDGDSGRRRSRRGRRSSGDGDDRDRSDRRDRSDSDEDRNRDEGRRFSRSSRRSDRDERRERRRGRRSEGTSSKEETGKPRVTFDLPSSYTARDKDADGQIGLYEWPQTDFATFAKLDFNGDGFLTPRELSNSDRKSSSPAVSSAATAERTARPAATSSSRSGSAPQEGDRYQRAAEFAFRALDRNKNGSVEAEEWKRSRSTRPLFEKGGVNISQTMSRDEFIANYVRLRSQ